MEKCPFTHEIENNNQLNFLDTLVIINQNNTVSIDLYKKSIALGRYRVFQS